MIRRPPRSTQSRSSAASDVYKRQSIERFYDLLKSIHKSGDTINVVKKGGEGIVTSPITGDTYDFRLDFSFTFSDKFSKDYKNIFTKYLQMDSQINRIKNDYDYTIYINMGEKIEGKKIIQAFKDGITNCLSTPMIKWCEDKACLLYTSPSPRDRTRSRMPSSA